MAIFLNDTFTEGSNTGLASHTPETGGSWVQRNVSSGGTTRDLRVVGGAGYVNIITGDGAFTNSATPAGTDYSVEVQWTPTGSALAMILLNWTAEGTCYRVWMDNYGDALYLERLSSWSGATIGTYAQTWNNSTTYTVRAELTVEGADKRIKVFVDGVERINYPDTAELAGVGLIGIQMDGGNMLSITAEDIGGGGTSLAVIQRPYFNIMGA